jgi:RNA polymerase sigma-70 factor (ECF subfamily)
MINKEEYKTAVHEYTKNVFRFLMKLLKDEEAAKDILQDCFLKLWQNRNKVDSSKIKSWLFTVAHHAGVNYMKKSGRITQLQSETGQGRVYQKHEFDLKSVIDKALNTLPNLQKSILLLRDLEGYEYREIAKILDISESQVRVYLFRARLKIKNTIKSIMHVI